MAWRYDALFATYGRAITALKPGTLHDVQKADRQQVEVKIGPAESG